MIFVSYEFNVLDLIITLLILILHVLIEIVIWGSLRDIKVFSVEDKHFFIIMIKKLFYTFMTFVVVHETRMHVERELWMSKSQGPVGVPVLN